jgi:hypothetical protein
MSNFWKGWFWGALGATLGSAIGGPLIEAFMKVHHLVWWFE